MEILNRKKNNSNELFKIKEELMSTLSVIADLYIINVPNSNLIGNINDMRYLFDKESINSKEFNIKCLKNAISFIENNFGEETKNDR